MDESKKPKPVSEFTEEQREWFRINKKYERKLQPFIGKNLVPGSPEHKKYKVIEQERDLEFLKFNEKHCKPEPIDTPDKLSKWIDQELVAIDMIKMANRGEFPFERAKEIYQKVYDYALELRTKNPGLPQLPDVLSDSLMGLKSMEEWCIDAQNIIDITLNLQSDLSNSKPFGFHSKRNE